MQKRALKAATAHGSVSGLDSDAADRVRAALLDASATLVLAEARVVLCDLTRAQIVRALGADSLAVNDLARVIGRHRTVISQHLRVLREAELVETSRRGRTVFYRLKPVPAIRVAQATLEAAARANS